MPIYLGHQQTTTPTTMNVLDQIISQKARLEYANSVLNNGCLPAWEAKEWVGLVRDYEAEIARLEKVVADNPEAFA